MQPVLPVASQLDGVSLLVQQAGQHRRELRVVFHE